MSQSLNKVWMRWGLEEDLPVIFQLLKEVKEACPKVLGLAWSREDLFQALRKKEIFLAENPIGVCGLIFFQRVPLAWDVKALATRVEFMGKGIMRILLKEWLELIPEGYEVWLETQGSNEIATKMYLSQGFEEVGRRPGYYSNGDEGILFTWRHI